MGLRPQKKDNRFVNNVYGRKRNIRKAIFNVIEEVPSLPDPYDLSQ